MSMNLTSVVPTILVAPVAAILIGATSGRAANDCSPAPNATAPRGSHWYYQINQDIGHHCWVLASQDIKQRQLSPRTASAAHKQAAHASDNSAMTVSLVMHFSQQWPNFSDPADIGQDTSAGNSYAEEQTATSAQNNAPIVWPMRSATEADMSAVAAIRTGHMFAILAGALTLAGIIMALLYRLAAIPRQHRPIRWNIASGAAQMRQPLQQQQPLQMKQQPLQMKQQPLQMQQLPQRQQQPVQQQQPAQRPQQPVQQPQPAQRQQQPVQQPQPAQRQQQPVQQPQPMQRPQQPVQQQQPAQRQQQPVQQPQPMQRPQQPVQQQQPVQRQQQSMQQHPVQQHFRPFGSPPTVPHQDDLVRNPVAAKPAADIDPESPEMRRLRELHEFQHNFESRFQQLLKAQRHSAA